MVDAAPHDGQDAQAIHVYHGVRTPDDLYAGEHLGRRAREFGIRFVPVYAEGGPGRIGLPHEAVEQDFTDLRASLIHVAGPPPMVDAVCDVATKLGAARERIRADAFHCAPPEKRRL